LSRLLCRSESLGFRLIADFMDVHPGFNTRLPSQLNLKFMVFIFPFLDLILKCLNFLRTRDKICLKLLVALQFLKPCWISTFELSAFSVNNSFCIR
jgi:hypothetical protein